MNAKEFAHELEKAASFIRQQQAEIEALKQIIDANNLIQNIGQFVKPTNEPVAWMDEETGCFVYSQYDYEDLDEHGKDGLIPLYTHPVELTEWEMKECWEEATEGREHFCSQYFDFAQLILRKAQEK